MTNKPMLSVELFPCPFCGSSAILEDHRLIWSVRCTKCSACVLGDRAPEPHGDGVSSDEVQDEQAAAMSESTDWAAYEKSAVDAWNSRSKPAAQQQGETVAVAMTDDQILEVMRLSITAADGGYVYDMSPEYVIAAGRSLLEVASLLDIKQSPVAVVMPERLNTEGGYSLEAETWYNLALDDVARLNGVTK